MPLSRHEFFACLCSIEKSASLHSPKHGTDNHELFRVLAVHLPVCRPAVVSRNLNHVVPADRLFTAVTAATEILVARRRSE